MIWRVIIALFGCVLSLTAAVKPKLLWFDATANFARLSSPDSIRLYLDRAVAVGFTDVVLDVKPITGEVLYPSSIAPRMTEWQRFVRPPHFDFVGIFLEEAKKRSLRVHAALNVFVAGHNYYDRGVVYSSRPDWQSILYTDSGLVPITRVKHKYSAMTNPAHKEIQAYELSILRELLHRYKFDGVILDRVRYDGIEADFSELSRSLFEQFLGKKLSRFPEDIYKWRREPTGKSVRVEGPFYKQWLEWRARVIKEFMNDARAAVKAVDSSIIFGVYTGSWYPIYYEVGVNWASKRYDPAIQFDWATPTYKETGYAELLDLYTSGNYYFEVTKEEVLSKKSLSTTEAGGRGGKEYWYSVEGSCEITKEVLCGVVPVYGGLYVEQYRGHPAQFKRAIEMCLRKSDGLMIFDLVHVINFGWWDVLEQAVKAGKQ
jgi:hypothetical protein